MRSFPSYPKILYLGKPFTAGVFNSELIVQEKVDGSFFGFGIDERGDLVLRSKNTLIDVNAFPKLFKEGVEYVLSIEQGILYFPENTFFYCEYLKTEKHNTLHYERIPKNHLVLFDCLMQGEFVDREKLVEFADMLNIDVIPELYRGKLEGDIDRLNKFFEIDSYLGKEKIEGIVIKNYNEKIEMYGHVFPLFVKYVRPEFREQNQAEWGHNKDKITEFIESFRTEARWEKAYQHLRERGLLKQELSDIGLLMKEVSIDIEEEEKENIKKFLWKEFSKKIKKEATKGLPDWYKKKLIDMELKRKGGE